MRSMTGFGKSQITENGITVSVEIKSVNNRFLDINVKLPKILNFVEDEVRKTLQLNFSRGRFDIFITYSAIGDGGKKVAVDTDVAGSMIAAATTLENMFGVTNDLTAGSLMKMPDVLQIEVGAINEDFIRRIVLTGVEQACEKLNEMRTHEGEQLKADIAARIKTVGEYSKKLADYAPTVLSDYREKLKQRISEALDGVEIDQSRLINEVAFFTDKCNIDEEITRLNSHITQMKKMLNVDDVVGRKLDFIVQELNREANTVCSKANNSEVTKIGVDLKCEIEKIREQVQNIE